MEIADTGLKRNLGLMFRERGEMFFVFKKDVKIWIWTPFMRFTIDIFFLDKKKRVIEVKRNMKPWRIYRPKKPYRYFFEAKAKKYLGIPIEKIKEELIEHMKKNN